MSQAVAHAALASAVWECDRHCLALSVEPWLVWRDVRKRLARESPGTADLRHAAVLAAVESAGAMLQAWAHWKARLPAAPIPGVA